MKRRLFIAIGIFIVLLVVAGLIANYEDGGRVTTGQEPKYCMKLVSRDGRKVTYWGLGYKVIRYLGVSPDEPYENNIGVKMGNWLMDYELPVDSEYVPEIKAEISSLDDFYNTRLTKGLDIRFLGEKYNAADAQKDGCFVIGEVLCNENVYARFMEDYEAKETAFIRVVQRTVEGDLILEDILYYQPADKLYLVTDSTRDEFSAPSDRKIAMREFERIAEYEYEGRLYWIVYNGEISDEAIQSGSDSVFVLALIH